MDRAAGPHAVAGLDLGLLARCGDPGPRLLQPRAPLIDAFLHGDLGPRARRDRALLQPRCLRGGLEPVQFDAQVVALGVRGHHPHCGRQQPRLQVPGVPLRNVDPPSGHAGLRRRSSPGICAAEGGSTFLLLATLVFGVDLAREFARLPKDAAGKLAGSMWVDKDPVIRDMIIELRTRPDGVALESGLVMANTQSPAVSLFAGKQSLLGWPWHETTWRGAFTEISERLTQLNAFYQGKLPDPLGWLLHNNVKYVLWMPRDNMNGNALFQPIFDKIRPRYFWHHMYGDERSFTVGYWERVDPPPAS